jgi:putative membrane protein
MLSAIVAGVLGLVSGTITGITPGLHINLVASIVAAYASTLKQSFSPLDIGIYLLVLSITHTFLDTIPQVFLGVADGSDLLSLLPSQRMVLQGRGMAAVVLHTMGALCCLILSVALVPFFVWLFPTVYTIVKPYTWMLLTAVLIFSIVREKDANTRFWSFIILLGSSTLGLITLRTLRLSDPLLPMLSGLFGVSGLVYALVSRTQLPPQAESGQVEVKPTQGFLAFISGTFAGSTIALLPGLGPAQAAIAARMFVPNLKTEAFMMLTGGINTVNMALSLVTMSTLGFARNGSFEVMLSITKRPDALQLLQFAGVSLLAGGVATLLTIFMARRVSVWMTRINYGKVSAVVLVFVTALVVWRTGIMGLLIMFVAAATGLVAILTGAPRHHLMACIIVPVIWATV